MNPLYNLLSGKALPNNVLNMITQFQDFKQNFHGDPKQMVQQMLNSGQISQEQYNQAVQMANELSKYLH